MIDAPYILKSFLLSIHCCIGDILNHIKREAHVQRAHMDLGTRRATKRKQQAWRKVLSDVDDTLYSSGGMFPAGIDRRYPRYEVREY